MKKKFDYKSFKKMFEEAECTDEYWIEKTKLDFAEDVAMICDDQCKEKDYRISEMVKICRKRGLTLIIRVE